MHRSLFLFLALAISTNAFAFVRTMSDSGVPLYWPNASVSFQINPTNSSGLSTSTTGQLLASSFQSWASTGAAIAVNTSTSTSYTSSSGRDGVNAIYFASNSSRQLGWGVVAVTEVIYYVSSGQIAETDMVFNDNQFLFTGTEGDTGKYINGRTAIYLKDVATHEAGHVFGLDHSLVGKSSLIYTAFSGQFSMGKDDSNAIQTIYPASGGKGSLRGHVQGLNGGIFGAHISAINMNSGKIEAGTLSNSDGSFRLGDIPEGDYALLIEPFGTDINSVSAYYQNVDHRFCGGNKFRRTFYSACSSGGKASVVSVHSGSSTELGTLSPQCSQMGNPGGAPLSISYAKEIPSQGGAMFGTLNAGETHYYKITNASGNIQAKVASYTLYSPVDVKVDILSANGGSLSGSSSIDNVENPMPGGYINYDSAAQATGLPSADYIVRVSSSVQRISYANFPAGYDLLDSGGHYLLMVGVNGSFGADAPVDMSACASVNNKSQSASYRAPSSEENTVTTGCGTIGEGGGPMSGMGLVALVAILSRLFLAITSANTRRKLVQAKR